MNNGGRDGYGSGRSADLEVQGADGGQGAAHGVADDVPRLVRVVRLQLPRRIRDVGLQAAGVVREEEPCNSGVNFVLGSRSGLSSGCSVM